MSAKVNIPRLECPFEIRISPLEAECEARLIEWLKSMELVKNEEQLNYFLGLKTSQIASRTIPDAPLDTLVYMAKLGSICVYYDDYADGNFGETDSESRVETLSRFKSMIKGETIEPRNAVEKAFDDLYKSGHNYFGPKMDYLKRKAHYYFRSLRWENKAQKQRRIPEIGEYLSMREISFFFEITVDLYLIISGIDPTIAILGQSPINDLYFLANRITFIINDLVSIEKEMKSKSVTNLVLVLKNGRKYSEWQSAIDEAVQMYEEAVEAFKVWEIIAGCQTTNCELDHHTKQYLAILKNFIGSLYYFHFENERYGKYSDERFVDFNECTK